MYITFSTNDPVLKSNSVKSGTKSALDCLTVGASGTYSIPRCLSAATSGATFVVVAAPSTNGSNTGIYLLSSDPNSYFVESTPMIFDTFGIKNYTQRVQASAKNMV